LLLNKKAGFTSFDSLAGIKRAFNTGKVGHTGTLDKFASGLLLILIGCGVKLVNLFENSAKEYIARLKFGAETDTLDPEGTVIATGKIPSRDEIEAVLDNFRGDILQTPPAYSAIHVNGRRAHELVREGKNPEMKKRPVTVFELEILSWDTSEAEIFTRVSSGTYIRSLARDIALAAGSRAYLSALKRTKVDIFPLEDSVNDNGDKMSLINALRPLDKNLFEALSLPCFFIDDKAAKGFKHGQPLEDLFAPPLCGDAKKAGVFRKNEPNELLGILEKKNEKWAYAHVFKQQS